MQRLLKIYLLKIVPFKVFFFSNLIVLFKIQRRFPAILKTKRQKLRRLKKILIFLKEKVSHEKNEKIKKQNAFEQ